MKNYFGRLVGLLIVATVVWPQAMAGDFAQQTLHALEQAIQSAHRSEKNKARDKWRHPKETLAFFGVKPTDTVVEIWPGGGWYTEILAPYVKGQGTLYAAHFPSDTEVAYYQKVRARFVEKMKSNPVYAEVRLVEFAYDNDKPIVPDGTADVVLTFRNVHNWMRGGDAGVLNAFKKFYAALKPGGVLGVVEHRLPENRPDSDQGKTGYMKESYVIRMAEKAGFKLEAKSEINANPKDTADHPKGVWTLPPSLRLGEKDKAKYLAIGESDRMTLRFVKPAQ
ncbi:MAG: methyltransferase domain-containing protein [Gammaproteobacteria bacterium]|nr:MAG: methyltransferase domain-containing protein [Gammaproteobacteria bacterium]